MTESHRCPTLSHLLTKLDTRPSSGKTIGSELEHPVAVAAPHHPVTTQFWETVWSAGEIVAIVTPGAADWPGPVTQGAVSRVTSPSGGRRNPGLGRGICQNVVINCGPAQHYHNILQQISPAPPPGYAYLTGLKCQTIRASNEPSRSFTLPGEGLSTHSQSRI